jgi:YD repeat-containing protein
MKILITLFFTFLFISGNAQYYYNDIIGTLETNRQMKNYLDKKVRTVSAKGFDPRGMTATDFSEYQELRENGTALKISTNTPAQKIDENGAIINSINKSVYYNRFDNQGRLISVTDSSSDIQNITTYSYDAAGRVSVIKSTSNDTSTNFNQVEVHQWIYGPNGKPDKMWRIINASDSLEIRFTPDENGNPGTEKPFRHGVETGQSYYYYDEQKQLKIVATGVVYYYFDDKNRLTDIVRYNLKAQRLLPDIMFEYDEQDHVIQRITTASNLHLGYLIWRYIYDDKGLKTKEALFNKDKELTGKIEYTYTFGQ